MTLDPVLPIIQGDWVSELADTPNPLFGRVRSSYINDGEILMDVIIYDLAGHRVGRVSPPEGGPTRFEPAIPWDAKRWTRIEKPKFPCDPIFGWRANPEKEGVLLAGYSVFSDDPGGGGFIKKAIRTTNVRLKELSTFSLRRITSPSSNGAEIEAAALRRAAQELRDTIRSSNIPNDVMATIRQRAEALEIEAKALSNGLG